MSDKRGSLSSFRQTLSKCLFLLGPGSRKKWMGLVVLAVFVSALEAVAALLVFVLLTLITAPGSDVTLPLLGSLRDVAPQLSEPDGATTAAAFAAVFFMFRGGIYLLQSFLQNHFAYDAGARLARRLVRGYLSMSYSAYVARNSAELIRNAHESTMALAAQALLPGIVLAAEVFVTVTLCAVLLFMAPVAAGSALLFLGILVLLLLRFVQPRLLKMGRHAQELTSSSLHSLQQTLVGFRDIRVLGREKFFENDFAETRQRMASTYAGRGVLIDTPRVALETSVLLVVLFFIALQLGRGRPVAESTTVLGLFGYVAFRILPSVNRVVNNLQSLKFAAPLIEYLYEDTVADELAPRVDPEPGQTEPEPFVVLEMKDVTYRYPSSDRDAVMNIDLTVERGQSIGLVGRTGSGKSTVLDLMLGLLEPTSGVVTVNGEPLSHWPRRWHHSIGLVPQTIFLLDDTIRRNVALGVAAEDIDDRLVNEALEIAQLQELVATSPLGLETMVGERGVKLSGGQRQRLAIARAMYRRPQVLMFDEGTSALDSRTESEVMHALSRLRENLTLITVAHRLSTVRECDVVVLLFDGRITATGTYEELLQTSTEFKQLARHDPDPSRPSGTQSA